MQASEGDATWHVRVKIQAFIHSARFDHHLDEDGTAEQLRARPDRSDGYYSPTLISAILGEVQDRKSRGGMTRYEQDHWKRVTKKQSLFIKDLQRKPALSNHSAQNLVEIINDNRQVFVRCTKNYRDFDQEWYVPLHVQQFIYEERQKRSTQKNATWTTITELRKYLKSISSPEREYYTEPIAIMIYDEINKEIIKDLEDFQVAHWVEVTGKTDLVPKSDSKHKYVDQPYEGSNALKMPST